MGFILKGISGTWKTEHRLMMNWSPQEIIELVMGVQGDCRSKGSWN